MTWALGSERNLSSGSTLWAKGTKRATAQKQERRSQWCFPAHARMECVERCEEGQAEVTMGDQGMRAWGGQISHIGVTGRPARSAE